ncbi:hypothetical protein QFW96_27485 [Saccharopolyspora sp. TS4A08]|uniref:RCK C-terminal domain-containing protein n=1 Tax=Saccharopolyspora ipomoeae TaxID=3042027 RepID=A0ABT6PXM5_9PSEU|nr:hypothetical protein [Saccharopolyspora sp. TS4A08]MDI2032393.1 hypothetical protein [Saccharopolyspora sp. TS4A08]
MWPTEDPTEQLRWRLECATTSGDGNVTVLVMGDRVGIVLPPGDTLIFTADEAEGLADLVDKALGYAVPG